MPPKCRFTKEEVIAAALEIVRRDGAEALTARSLGDKLGSSSKPVFGQFEGMAQVQQAVGQAAYAMYEACLREDMARGEYPPYKASGMAYIRFAREEKHLFRLLFMRDRTGEEASKEMQGVDDLITMIMKNTGLTEEKARLMHLELWCFVHGVAVMAATGFLNWDNETVSRMMTDTYQGLVVRHGGIIRS